MVAILGTKRTRTTGGATAGSLVEWTGSSGDNDWSTAGNWSGASVPVQMDRVYIGKTTQDITSGLNQASITLERLQFGAEWTGSMETLQINSDLLVVDKRFGDLALNGTFPKVYIYNTGASTSALTLTGTYGTIYVFGSRGKIKISNSATVTSLICVPYKRRTAQVEIGTGASMTTIEAYGYTNLTTSSSVTNLTADENAEITLTVTGSPSVSTAKAWGSSLWHYNTSSTLAGAMYENSRIVFNDNTNSNTLVSGFTMYGGTLDLRTGINTVDH